MGVPSLTSLKTGAVVDERAGHGLAELFGEEIPRSDLTEEGLLALVYDPLLFSNLLATLNSALQRDDLKARLDAHAPKLWRDTFLPRLEFQDHGRTFELTTSHRVHHRRSGTLVKTLVKTDARVSELCASRSESAARREVLTFDHFYETLNKVPAEHHVLLPLVRHVAARPAEDAHNFQGLRPLFDAVLRAGDPLFTPIQNASVASVARVLLERLNGLTAERDPRLDATVKALDHSAKENQGDGVYGFVAVIVADAVARETARVAMDVITRATEAEAEPPAEA